MNTLLSKFTSFALAIALLTGATPIVNAAGILSASDIMSSQKIGASSTHTISFESPTAIAGGGTFVLTFPSDFDLTGATESTNLDTALLSGTGDRTLTLTSTGGETAGHTVTASITGTALNPTSPGTYTITIVGSNGDTGDITVPILTDDQVNVTAKVNQTLSFAISDESVGFGNLDSGNTRYATGDLDGTTSVDPGAHQITAGTNAPAGYTIAVEGDTLTSGTDTIDKIVDEATLLAGSEQFGLKARYISGGITPTISTSFDGYGMPDAPTTPETLASQASASDINTYDIDYAANIAVLTEAGNYATTFTYTMTANF